MDEEISESRLSLGRVEAVTDQMSDPLALWATCSIYTRTNITQVVIVRPYAPLGANGSASRLATAPWVTCCPLETTTVLIGRTSSLVRMEDYLADSASFSRIRSARLLMRRFTRCLKCCQGCFGIRYMARWAIPWMANCACLYTAKLRVRPTFVAQPRIQHAPSCDGDP